MIRVHSTAFDRSRCTAAPSTTSPTSAGRCGAGSRHAAGSRALHDRSADGRRRGAPRRPSLPGAACRRQPGRLPRDRGRAEAARRTPCSSGCSACSPASICDVPTSSSRSARRCEPGSRRRARRRSASRVIPNWVDTKAVTPQPRDNAWARANGLDGRFVVMHSGNVGHAQDLETLIRAPTFLRDLDDLPLVVIGSGARHADHRRAGASGSRPSLFWPTSRASCSRSRSRARTSTSSASAVGSPASSFPAACTGSSPPADR